MLGVNMSELPKLMATVSVAEGADKNEIMRVIKSHIAEVGYTIVEENMDKPWGGYVRLSSQDADGFISDFFPGLSPVEARMNIKDAEVSPKFLLVQAGHRLSWQYHNYRAERWNFLTDGAYVKSMTDEQTNVTESPAGTVVQFAKNERHRLIGAKNHYTIVAEIWQHTDSEQLSDEEDIIRLDDDYKR